jgi:ribosomal protein L40E
MSVREMEQRLMVLVDGFVAVRERPARPWTCWRCNRTNAPKTTACVECGSRGAPSDPDAAAEYRTLHARWMVARGLA